MKPLRIAAVLSLTVSMSFACTTGSDSSAKSDSAADSSAAGSTVTVAQRLARYTTVPLAPDLSLLTAKEQQMLPLLIEAAKAMDDVYWREAYGDPAPLLASITDPDTRKLVEVNYGPWDRLDNNAPFIPGVGPKPPGAGYYPKDITKEEFEAAVASGGAKADSLKSLYTIVQRNPAGGFTAIPFHRAFAAQHQLAATKLREAAALAEDPGLKRYLNLRAEALLTDNYQPSDMAWMDMKNNNLEIVIGPIETYEDALFGYKATHEGFVLIKDKQWSSRLAKYSGMLPALQRGIPVAEQFKREVPAAGSDLNAYDIIYVSGDANKGSKTIAINLPNDEEVQLKKGTRRLQLKNAMRAKFDKILMPIARELIVDDQVAQVTFDSFFENVMFHEVAHGLGIKNTVNNTGPVRTALKERASALEEGKADILGLYMIRQLSAQNETATPSMDDNYVTFIAGLFRSVRFGAASAHGRANVAAFNSLEKMGAFTRESSGKYRVNLDKIRQGVDALSQRILEIQGNGDYAAAGKFADELGTISPTLQGDLDRLGSKAIPVDIIYDRK